MTAALSSSSVVGRHRRPTPFTVDRHHARLLAAVAVPSLVAGVAQLTAMLAVFTAVADDERRLPAICVGVAGLLVAYAAGTASDRRSLAFKDAAADDAERRVWSRLLSLPTTFFADRSLRDTIGYASSVGMVRTLLGALGVEAAISALTALAATGLLSLVDVRLGLASVAMATTLLAVAVLLARRQQRHDLVVMESVDEAHATLYPALLGLEELAAYRAQDAVEARWAAVFRRQKDADLAGLRYADAGESLLLSTQAVMLAALCPLALAWTHGIIAMGSVTMIVLQLAMALGRVAAVLPAAFSVGIARHRLRDVMDSAPEQVSGLHPTREVRGALEFADVTYSYSDQGRPILRGVSLAAKPGEMIAVVGPSGAGKSTLLRLALAQLEPTRGDVSVDGIPTSQWDHENLRAQIGYVPQSAELQRGTIRDAVVGVLAGADDEVVTAALVDAGLGPLLDSLPMGLDTRISDGASGFSGGQEQRLLLARALVRAPRILLLDEATSALDEDTQSAVAQAVARLGMTRIVVAHRHSTIRAADRIYVLDGGHVVEDGTYHELISRGGHFARLTRTHAEATNPPLPHPHR